MRPGLGSTVNAVALAGFVRGYSRFPLWLLMSLFFAQVEHVSYFDIGLIFMGREFLAIPMGLYGGSLTDRMGRRRLMLFSVTLSLASFSSMLILVYLNLSVILILVAFYAAGLAASLQRVINSAIISDVSTESQRISAFGRLRIFSNAGVGVGMVSAGLAYSYSIVLFFLVPVVGAFIELLVYGLFVHETAPARTVRRGRMTDGVTDWNLIKASVILAFSGLVAIMFLTPMFPLYFSEFDSLSPVRISILFALNTVVVVLFQVPVNRIAERRGEVMVLSAGLIIYSICYLCFGILSDFYLVALLVTLLSLGENMVLPMGQAIISKMAPPERRGYYFGTFSTVNGFIQPLGPIIGMSMLQIFVQEPFAIWVLLMAFGFINALAVLSLRVRRKPSGSSAV